MTHVAHEIVLDCAIRLPCPLAWPLFRLLAQVQSIVNQANCIVYSVLFLTCHTTSQVHPHRRACVGLQCYKRDRFYLCVRILDISPLDLTRFFLYSLVTVTPRSDGLITLSPLTGQWVAWADRC